MLKRIFVAFLFFVALFAGSDASSQTAEWFEGTIDEVKAAAESSGKYIIVVFPTGCG